MRRPWGRLLAIALATVATSLQISAKELVEDNDNVTVTFAGDCSIGCLSVHSYDGTFNEAYDKFGPDYFFKNVKEYFANDDLTLVNFEGVLTRSNTLVEKAFNIKGRPEFIGILPQSSIEAVSFGNNHRIDYGQQGIDDTIDAFESAGIVWAYDENIGIYETENGIKIGYLSVNEVYDKEAVEPLIKNGIKTLKEKNVDIVIACTHWGIEGDHYPDEYQQKLGHMCLDLGADIVVGTHPHVLQGIECYKGKYIIYSLGNFCFGGNKNPSDKNTMLIQADFHVGENGVDRPVDLTIVPCTLSSVSNRNDYCPTPATGDKKDKIINLVNKYSENLNLHIDDAGHVN